ncbi:Golgin subfamily A member 5 [Dillenia turbinata]|uniref:Golgin subfamily A member 5 n=1 Tax=Dillenia turbinata TaxID=194707 RepID=A0AAN8WAC1_9MAGN
MASWLKAAEDRRAKLVVSELADDQSTVQTPAANGQGSQAKKGKPKAKGGRLQAQKKKHASEHPKTSDSEKEQTSAERPVTDSLPAEDEPSQSTEDEVTNLGIAQTSIVQQRGVDEDVSTSRTPLSGTLPQEVVKNDSNNVEVPATSTEEEATITTSNGDLVKEGTSDVHDLALSSPSHGKSVEVNGEVPQSDTGLNNREEDPNVHANSDQERIQAVNDDVSGDSTPWKIDADPKIEPHLDQKKQQGHKADGSPMKVQDQLDEAQGLLKTAVSTGQSKEARLARVCAGLSSRLQEYKSENTQLEELLTAERELSKSYEAQIRQLQQEISVLKTEVTNGESSMAEALAAKNSEIEALVSSIDSLKKQAALSEGNLASVQANMESIMRNRELTETRMMQALREELASAERRAEEERAAHSATKMAAMEREVELEHRAVEATTALARVQRVADERTAKASELEQKIALLEVECASLNQELQEMEARARRGQKKSPEDANQVIQMQAWQEEVERARQCQRDAESKLSTMEAEVQKMRVEMSAMKRDAEHYSRQEHMELEKRYRELTDLLYYKQTQLENMATEKAAAEFQLEKELKRLQEAQVEAERSKISRRASSSWEEDSDMKTLESLPLYHRHMVGASEQLQKAAKILDTGAARATRFLWRNPVARLMLLFYLVFVHLFLMYLLHRLQEQADSWSSREVAESMGLTTPKLP